MEYILRDVNYANDFNVLYQLIQEDINFRDKVFNSINDFMEYIEHNLKGNYHCFSIVSDSNCSSVLGIIYAYDYRVFDNQCKVSFMMSDNCSLDAMEKIVKKYIEWLFIEYPLNKVFVYIDSLNEDNNMICKNIGMRMEATIRDYYFINGKYCSLNIWGIKRRMKNDC